MDGDKALIELAAVDFVTFDDGYIYWWPDVRGGLSAHDLRVVADELDRRNAEWDKEVQAAHT